MGADLPSLILESVAIWAGGTFAIKLNGSSGTRENHRFCSVKKAKNFI